MKLHKKSLSVSTSLTLIFITIITIWSESSSNFKNLLKSLTSHHWISKGLLSLILFAILYFALAKLSKDNLKPKDILIVSGTAIICGAIIFGFYILHYIG